MNLQRKLTLMVTTAGVAFGAGHFVQKRAETRQPADSQPMKITALAPVAAGPEALAVPALDFRPPLPAEAAPIEPAASETRATPAEAPAETPAETRAAPAAATTLAAADPAEPMPPARAAIVPPASLPATAPPEPTAPKAAADPGPAPELAHSCDVQFDLVAQPGAMIGLTVLAPCNPQERVVLWHAGLAVTARTSSTGALFTSLPALTEDATVEVRFASGERVTQSILMPEAKDLKRFAVQWQDGDAFQLHAFEAGASYGQPGHFSAAFTGTAAEGGSFVSILGDAATDLPLLAEVFTFGRGKTADVVVEASVSAATCGRTIFGEMIASDGGKVDIQDLTLAMPECDGLGDILVLKNLMQDMKLAATR